MKNMDKDFLEWYKDGNVVVKVDINFEEQALFGQGPKNCYYFATQDAQYKNRIAHNMTALFEYYTKEFINQ